MFFEKRKWPVFPQLFLRRVSKTTQTQRLKLKQKAAVLLGFGLPGWLEVEGRNPRKDRVTEKGPQNLDINSPQTRGWLLNCPCAARQEIIAAEKLQERAEISVAAQCWGSRVWSSSSTTLEEPGNPWVFLLKPQRTHTLVIKTTSKDSSLKGEKSKQTHSKRA